MSDEQSDAPDYDWFVRNLDRVVDDVGFVCGRLESDGGRETELIGLLIEPNQDEPHFWMTLGCVKNLIVKLSGAVDACLEHDRNERRSDS